MILKKQILIGIIFISVVLIDNLFKGILHSPVETLHEKSNMAANIFFLGVAWTLFFVSLLWEKYGTYLVVFAAGGAANAIDSLNGDIENPFVVFYSNKIVGFNFADVVVIISLMALISVVLYDRLRSTFGNSSVDSSAALRTRRS